MGWRFSTCSRSKNNFSPHLFMKLLFSKAPMHRTHLLCALLFGLAGGASAQWMQQSIPLRPGWNAVFLEVQPEPEECDALFAGLPVESVWDYNRSVDAPQFVQDPSALIPGAPGWLTWFPPNHPLAGQSSLFLMRDGRSYLIKVASNAPPANWMVTGRPPCGRPVGNRAPPTCKGFMSARWQRRV